MRETTYLRQINFESTCRLMAFRIFTAKAFENVLESFPKPSQNLTEILERSQGSQRFPGVLLSTFSRYGRSNSKFGPTYFVRIQYIFSPQKIDFTVTPPEPRALLLSLRRTRSIFRRLQTPTNFRRRIQVSSDARLHVTRDDYLPIINVVDCVMSSRVASTQLYWRGGI